MLLGYFAYGRESKEERGKGKGERREGLLRWSVLGALNNQDEEDLCTERERDLGLTRHGMGGLFPTLVFNNLPRPPL